MEPEMTLRYLTYALVYFICNDKILWIISPILFSVQFMLLGLSSSQYLIGRFRLGVDVDNTKQRDLFPTRYVPYITSI